MLSGVSDLDVSAQTRYKEATWPRLRCSRGFVPEAEVDPVQSVESHSSCPVAGEASVLSGTQRGSADPAAQQTGQNGCQEHLCHHCQTSQLQTALQPSAAH